MTEIEVGALRGCGDRDRFECTMGMKMGASHAWEWDIKGWMVPQGWTGMWKGWRWWHQERRGQRGAGGIAGMEQEAVLGWGHSKSGLAWAVGSGCQDCGASRARCFSWQPLPMQHLPASVVWLGLQPCPGVTAASLSLESLQEWGRAGLNCSLQLGWAPGTSLLTSSHPWCPSSSGGPCRYLGQVLVRAV